MLEQFSTKKQLIIGISILIIILVGAEILSNFWWYNIFECRFENNELFADLDEETRRKRCLENIGLQITENGILPDQSGQSININSEGFRGPEITKEKPEDTYRIFAVGGSTTFGIGVNDDETATAYLQNMFDNTELNFNVEVINAGIPGESSKGEVQYIKEKLIEYDPDLFIVYDGVNDLENLKKVDGVSQWKERWLEICNLGKNYGFDTVITIQPVLGTGTRIPTVQEIPFFQEIEKTDFMKPYPLYMEQFEELNASCTMTADLRGIFDSVQETIFFDATHVNSKGNYIIAENWYKISLPFILNKTHEITSGNDEALNSKAETTNKISSINFNSIYDKSLNALKKLFLNIQGFFDGSSITINKTFLSYKTPKALLNMKAVFWNEFEQTVNSEHKESGVEYIMSDKTSCNALGGVWNNVQFCSVSNLTIKAGDTVYIKQNAYLKILEKLVNYGTIIVDKGVISNVNSKLINEGTIIINSFSAIRGVDGSISNNGGNITINDGAIANFGGTINNNLDGIITTNFGGSIINLKGGSTNNNLGIIIINVKSNFFNMNYSKFTNHEGSIIINNMGSIINQNSEINNDGGAIINSGGNIINSGGEIINQGSFNSTGNIYNKCGGVITDKLEIFGPITEIPCT